MIWAPDIDGRLRGGERVDFNISFSDILDRLSFGFDRWGLRFSSGVEYFLYEVVDG